MSGRPFSFALFFRRTNARPQGQVTHAPTTAAKGINAKRSGNILFMSTFPKKQVLRIKYTAECKSFARMNT